MDILAGLVGWAEAYRGCWELFFCRSIARPVHRVGGSLEHGIGRPMGVGSVQVLGDLLPESNWDDWSVIVHD